MSSEAENVDTVAAVDATEADKINTGALGTLVAVGLFAMISITAAMTALVRHDLDAEEAQKATDANRVVTELKAAQRGALTGAPTYVDRNKGLVSLPIDVAKAVVVKELERDPGSATPPPSAVPAQLAPAAVDSGAAAATLGTGGAAEPNKGAATAKPTESSQAPKLKPEPGREVTQPAPGSSAKSAPVSAPTPTAATPGAQAPGPTNK